MNINAQKEQANAAYVLNDDIYPILRNARLAHLLLNDIHEHRIDDENLATTKTYELQVSMGETNWRLDILVDYLVKVVEALERLDDLGRAEVPPTPASDSEKVLALLTEGVKRGVVSEAQLRRIEQDLGKAFDKEKSRIAQEEENERLLFSLLEDASGKHQVSSKKVAEILSAMNRGSINDGDKQVRGVMSCGR